MNVKSEQLQIRVTPEQKAALKRQAQNAGLDVSSYVLARVLPDAATRFGEIIASLGTHEDSRFALAALNDLLSGLTRPRLVDATSTRPPELDGLSQWLQNYVAAMVEQAASLRRVPAPGWVRAIPPLDEPYFATNLRSLRLHLLRSSPAAFKRRNLFVDASIGARV